MIQYWSNFHAKCASFEPHSYVTALIDDLIDDLIVNAIIPY